MADERVQGCVRWFDDARGYGFITSDAGADVFVHHTAIQEKGHRKLADGERVEFGTEPADKGLKAVHVVKLAAVTADAE